MKALHFIFIMVISLITGNCQVMMSLNECIEYACKHNLDLNQYQYQLSKSMVALRQTKLNCLPSVIAEYNHFISSGRSLNQEIYEWENNDMQQGNMALTAGLTIFQGLHSLHRQKSAKSGYEAIGYSLEKARLHIGLEIIQYYHEIILTTSSIGIIELTHQNTMNEINSLKEQIIAGTMSKSSLYELTAQSYKEQLQIEALEADRDKNYLMLVRLMNWPMETAFLVDSVFYGFTASDTSVYSSVPDVMLENILRGSPEIMEKEFQLRATKYEIQMQKSLYYPAVRSIASFSSRYMKNAIDPTSNSNYEYISQIDNNQYKQLALSVSVPVFDRNSRNTNVKLARIEYERLQNEKEMVWLQLKKELLLISEEIESLSHRIIISQEMTSAFQQSYETAAEKFNAGLLNAYELTLAKNNYTSALLELNKTMVQYSMNMELLKLYGLNDI